MDRIPAVGRTLMVPSSTIDQRKLPTTGETVLLIRGDSAGDDILITTGNGLSFRLAGLGWLGAQLKAGDTLPVRVLSTHPILELEIAGPPSPSKPAHPDAGTYASSAMSQHAAMRLDQAEIRTISWRLASPSALAAAWRTLAQERWQQPESAIDPWMSPVYAWGGIQISMRLIEADDEPPQPRSSRRRGGWALRLSLSHPTLGRIVIQVQWTPHGIRLTLVVEESASVDTVRSRLPAVVTALAQVNLRLARVSVTQGSAAVAQASAAPARPATRSIGADALSPVLFRAAAEIVVAVLLSPLERSRFSQANR